MSSTAKVNQLKNCIQIIRANEILYTVIHEIEKDNFEKNDFEDTKEYVLDCLYQIKISKLKQYAQVDELEEKLYEILGDNFILFVPEKSELIIKLEKLLEKKRRDM